MGPNGGSVPKKLFLSCLPQIARICIGRMTSHTVTLAPKKRKSHYIRASKVLYVMYNKVKMLWREGLHRVPTNIYAKLALGKSPVDPSAFRSIHLISSLLCTTNEGPLFSIKMT